MLTYADGTALCRGLVADLESVPWLRWSSENADRLVTSPLGITELRRTCLLADPVARAKAHAIRSSIRVLRFSDQALEPAAMSVAVLGGFRALHLGVALTEKDVDAIATYDRVLAQAARVHGIRVVTPGRADGWWDA